MDSLTLINMNGQGLMLDSKMVLIKQISGHDSITAGELLIRAQKARETAQRYIEAAENMEKLVKLHTQ